MRVSSTASLRAWRWRSDFRIILPVNKRGLGMVRLRGAKEIVTESNWEMGGELDQGLLAKLRERCGDSNELEWGEAGGPAQDTAE